MYKANNNFLALETNIKALGDEAGSKLCFIDKDNMYTIGAFIEEADGVLYSNTSYQVYDYFYDWDYNEYSIDFDYFDIFDVEGVPLTLEDFTLVLDKLDFVKDDTVSCTDGYVYINNNDLVVDKNNNLFSIDYNNLAYEYLGEVDYLKNCQ